MMNIRAGLLDMPSAPAGVPSSYEAPGPPGCWTFHLSWSGHTDELKLRYVA
jgi:hypothetical protein